MWIFLRSVLYVVAASTSTSVQGIDIWETSDLPVNRLRVIYSDSSQRAIRRLVDYYGYYGSWLEY